MGVCTIFHCADAFFTHFAAQGSEKRQKKICEGEKNIVTLHRF